MFNSVLFGLIAILVGDIAETKAVEAIPIRMITLAPKPKEQPKPIPRKKAKKPDKKKLKKKVKPKPPMKKIVGLSKEKKPEPVKPPEEIVEPEPDYQPLYSLSALPSFVRQVSPKYPEHARFAGKEAKVLAEVSIDVSGSVRSVRIIESSGEEFDQAVIDAIGKSLFTPGYQRGRPVAVRVQIPYSFKLR